MFEESTSLLVAAGPESTSRLRSTTQLRRGECQSGSHLRMHLAGPLFEAGDARGISPSHHSYQSQIRNRDFSVAGSHFASPSFRVPL